MSISHDVHPRRPVDRSVLRGGILCLAIVCLSIIAAGAAAAESTGSAADFLATWKLDRAARVALEDPDGWTDTKLSLCLRLLARLTLAPVDAYATWVEKAPPADAATTAGDALVRLEGRARFVASLALSPELAEVANRPAIDVVRIETPHGIVDVIADAVPKAWRRWEPIDEPVSVVGVPVSTAAGPTPVPPAGTQAAWPTGRAGLVVVARRVAWHPATALGGLGMDYGLFDTVADGHKLVAGDTDAFYALLAAVGRGAPPATEAVGPVTDAVPLIDAARGWFARHRGDPVVFQGTARRATRIQIDEPRRRREIGGDHYWELYVFVPTSLIKINGRLQETYPIVCCVRELPDGMPTGQAINEQVRISGFAMKRYAYPLPRSQADEQGGGDQRQETPLVIARRARWLPEPSSAAATGLLGWVFLGLAGLVGLGLAVAAWRFNRDARRERQRQRASLPDKLQLP